MGLDHHGQGDMEAIRRFMDEMNGISKRAYPQGRMGADDDGEFAYALTTDERHQTIVIRFPKPVEWVGLGLEQAVDLRDRLTERIMHLRGITA